MSLIAFRQIAQTRVIPTGGGENFKWSAVGQLLGNVTAIALDIAGGIALIYVFIGAIQYFTAYGNEQKAEEAKKTLLWAFIGAMVIIASRIIITWVFKFASTTTPTF